MSRFEMLRAMMAERREARRASVIRIYLEGHVQEATEEEIEAVSRKLDEEKAQSRRQGGC